MVSAHHDHHDTGHHHVHQAVGARLVLALLLTLAFSVVEAVAGYWSGSLALLGDAAHMLADSASLGLAAFAVWLAKRPPSSRHSYGLGRVETLAALCNVIFMIVLVFGIVAAAVHRLRDPAPVDGLLVSWVAAVGLLINIAVAYVLMRGEQTMNTRAALLHVLGDLLGSVAALLSGVVIVWTAWMPIDPLLSLLIGGLILFSSLRLLREILRALLEGVPAGVSLEQVGQLLAAVPGVCSVHDLHIWTLASNRTVLSAHLVLERLSDWPGVMAESRYVLLHQGIEHVTLQPELLAQPLHWHSRALYEPKTPE